MSDDDETAAPQRLRVVDRLLPPAEQVGDDGHPKASRMAPREQLVAAGLGVANVAITVGTASTLERGQALVLLGGLLASALTLVGARVGNRILALVGLFAATLTQNSGGPLFLVVVLPYYAAAIWIFLRYNRVVKEQGALRRKQRAEQRTAGGGARTDRTSAKGRAKNAKKTSAKAAPPKSKRYTPPKARRKPPPPPPKPPRDRSIVD